mgnify:CR=1 FL=1
MSKSWTPEELAAASAAMKAEGHMSYEESAPRQCCGWNTEAATAGVAPSTSATVALCRCRPTPEQTGRHLHEAGQRL